MVRTRSKNGMRDNGRPTDRSALRYAFKEVDLLEEGDSRTQQVLMVGTHKKVLEIGPASGYVTKALRSRGCDVTCVEIDPKAARAARKYANRMINADIETLDLGNELRDERYDAILFGDVLEHLKDPHSVLRRLRPYLKPSGCIVATVPNVAHGSVRLLLLDGKFDPQASGILDWTHLHFYTRKTLLELFKGSGYSVELVKEVKVSISAAENLKVNLKKYPPELIRAIESDPDSTTHAFALVARPATMNSASQRIPTQKELVSLHLDLARRSPSDPLSTLLHLYIMRRDLQAAFPEVRRGNYHRLLEWANNTIRNRGDKAYRLLRRYTSWYRDNPISSELEVKRLREALERELASQKEQATSLQSELAIQKEQAAKLEGELASQKEQATSLQSELAIQKEQAAKLEGELASQKEQATSLEKELVRAQKEFRAAAPEIDSLRAALRRAQSELDGIEGSLGYRLIKFYGSRIDRAFPDNTKRGELKKIVKESLRIASSQGVMVLFRLVLEKLRRREFKVARSLSQVTIEAPLRAVRVAAPQRELASTSPQAKIVLETLPRLSLTEPTKVSNTIILSGWAVSHERIREIRIYLDDKFVGLANYGLPRNDVGEAYPEFPDSYLSGFHKLIHLDQFGNGGPYGLRIAAQTDSMTVATVEGLLEIEQEIRHQPIQSTIERVQRRPTLETTVSVIILTKKPPADFEQTLERLRGQVGVPDPEIVIVNSGDCDLTPLATKYRLKVYSISPEEFDHATTRNYAAQKATGEYLVFLTDDAIPAREDLVYNMIEVLRSDSAIAAVTARQIPRSDADLMYCQAIWGHYRMMGLNRDRIVGSTELDKMPYEQKRPICQIDDVCSCFHRDTFLRYKFAKGYAEDLELGTRLVKDGFRIAQLFSTGVIHSHNRPPSYHLKRNYVDFQALRRLLNYGVLDFGGWSVESLNDLLDLILWLHCSLNTTIDDLVASRLCGYDIQKVFSMIRDRIDRAPHRGPETKRRNEDLSENLREIMKVADYRDVEKKPLSRNPLAGQFALSIDIFQNWLINSHQDLRNVETDFIETLYKLFAVQAGHILAQYVAYAQIVGSEKDKITALDRFLSEGI